MKKKVFGRKLSRERDTRRALFRSLTRALVLNGKIETTKAKALSVQPFVENLIKIAKQGSVESKRRLSAFLANDAEIANLLIKSIKSGTGRKSGFTRIVPLPRRRGDMAKMVRFEWSEKVVSTNEKVSDKSKKGSSEKTIKKGKTEKTQGKK
jgi:large subunit ribosomal protein L17